MAVKDSGMHIASADVTYNGGAVTIVIPDGNYIFDVVFEVTTVWDGDGTVIVGYTGDTDAFLTDAGIAQGSLGFNKASAGAAAKAAGHRVGVGEDVIITPAAGTSTQGVGKVMVFHGVTV